MERTLTAHHNLPPQPTSFIGREDEIAEITFLLDDPACRLLTLTGPGGIGKTRLAVEVASRKLDEFPDGVYFVPLQPLTSHENVVPTIATSLGLQLEGRDPKQSLLNYLREKSLLLLMDNLEHLLEAVDLLLEILLTTRQAKLLVTSREALNIREEWLRPIKGLPVPSTASERDIRSFESVHLFMDRVHRVRPDFSLIREGEDLVALCQLVEGMPLALELAASWLKAMPCSEIVTEIRQSQDFLTTNLRDVPERHRSMHAVFEHSWRLLSDGEREVFRKLSVFQGGCQREAAQEVVGASLHALSALVDKSLLRMTPDGRYEMHELLRQFGQQKLDEAPEVREATLDRHSEYYAAFLHKQEKAFDGPESTSTLNAIEAEINNVRAAWSRAVDQRRVDLIDQAIRSLHHFYDIRDWYQEGESVFGCAAAALNTQSLDRSSGAVLGLVFAAKASFSQKFGQKDRAKQLLHNALKLVRRFGTQRDQRYVLFRLGVVTYARGEFVQAQAWIQESLSIAAATDGTGGMAYDYLFLSFIFQPLGDYQAARQAAQESLNLSRQIGESFRIGYSTRTLGVILGKLGEYREAKQLLQEALVIFEMNNRKWVIANVLEDLGGLNHALGEYEQARSHLERSLTIGNELNFSRRVTFTLVRLGELACGLGNYDEARDRFQECREIASASGEAWQQALSLSGLGQVAYHQGNYAEAKRLQQQTLALCKQTGYRLGIVNALKDLGLIAAAMDANREARQYLYQALLEGIEIAVPPFVLDTLVGIATLIADEGQHEHAVELLALSEHHPASHADTRAAARKLLAELETRLPPDVFASAQQRGKKHDLFDVAEGLLTDLLAPQNTTQFNGTDNPLTRREREVVRLMDSDLSYPDIADLLHISPNTIKVHRSNIYNKLDVHSRDEAIAVARELGLL